MPHVTTLTRVRNLPADAKTHVALSWSKRWLLLFTLVEVGRVQEVIPMLSPLRLGLLTAGLMALAWAMAPGTLQQKLSMEIKQVRYVLLLLVLAVITVPISYWPGGSVRFLIDSFVPLVLFFLFVLYWCRSIKDVRRMIWVCCLGAIGLVFAGILTGRYCDHCFGGGSTYDPNDLALLLVMILPLLMYLFSISAFSLKLVAGGMLFMCLYGIVRTESRGGFVALVVVGVFIMWRGKLSRANKVAVTVIAVLIMGVLAGSAYWDRMETIWNPQTEYDREGGGRTTLWKAGLGFMVSAPWGVGINQYTTAEGLSHGGAAIKWSTAHNSFLQLGVELGIAGLVLFIMLLARTIKQLLRIQFLARESSQKLAERGYGGTKKRLGSDHDEFTLREVAPLANALEISLWGFVVGGFFLSQAYSSLLYAVVALSLCCIRLAGDHGTASENAKAHRSRQG